MRGDTLQTALRLPPRPDGRLCLCARGAYVRRQLLSRLRALRSCRDRTNRHSRRVLTQDTQAPEQDDQRVGVFSGC